MRIGVDGEVGARGGIGIGIDRNAMKGRVRYCGGGGCGVVVVLIALMLRMAVGRVVDINATRLPNPNFAILKTSASICRPLHSFRPYPALMSSLGRNGQDNNHYCVLF